VATSGRSFWILDDLSPIQQAAMAARGAAAEEAFLYAPRHAYRMAGGPGFGGGGEGQNPPTGAVLDFVLPKLEDGQEVKIEIRTENGDLVRTLSTQPDDEISPSARPLAVTPGHNRITWNLRHESIPNIPGAYVFGSLAGRPVVPGNYDVRLTVGDWTMGHPLEVRMDPRTDATMADYLEQDAFVAGVAAELSAIHRAVAGNNDVRSQIETLLERVDGLDGADAVTEAGTELAGDMETVADSLYQRRVVDGQTVINFPSRLKFQYVFLHGNAGNADGDVSMGSQDVLSDLRARWTVHQATNDQLMGPRLDDFNDLVREAGFSFIIAPPRPRRPIS